MNAENKMLIGVHIGNGYGSQPGAWRMPGVDPKSYTSFDARVKQARKRLPDQLTLDYFNRYSTP